MGKTVIAIVGPTATGKSALAARLARVLPGEVLSCDSMQIYRGMDIGTAKAGAEERQGAPHHLLDLRQPWESFTVADFQRLAREAADAVLLRGKTPVLAGGTGLYVDSVVYNYEYKPEDDTEKARVEAGFRALLQKPGDGGGKEALWTLLTQADPGSAQRLHPNDTKRIIRALAYRQIHGQPISENTAASTARAMVYPVLWLGLQLPRDLLYRRIDQRVDEMMAAGLLGEVAGLRERGLRGDSQAGQAIGYKQLLAFLDGACGLEEAVDAIKRESRRYAKRQMTWYRGHPNILWLDGQKVPEKDFAQDFALLFHQTGEGEEESAFAAFFRAEGLLYD